MKIKDTKINSLNKSQGDIATNDVFGNYKSITRENKLKEIFSSKGLVNSSMNDNSQLTPLKDRTKITSKGYGKTIEEIKLGNQDFKKYRKNSAHNFSNKCGFYMQ